MFKKITTDYDEKDERDDQSVGMNLSTAEDDECGFYEVDLDVQPESPGLSQDFQLSFVEVSEPIEAENDQVEIEQILQEFGQPLKQLQINDESNKTDQVDVQSTIDFTDLQQKSSNKGNANQVI